MDDILKAFSGELEKVKARLEVVKEKPEALSRIDELKNDHTLVRPGLSKTEADALPFTETVGEDVRPAGDYYRQLEEVKRDEKVEKCLKIEL